MATVNETLADSIIEQAINIERVSASQRVEVLKLLKELEDKLVSEIATIDPSSGKTAALQKKRLEKLLEKAEEATKGIYRQTSSSTQTFLSEVASAEVAATTVAINNAVGFNVANLAGLSASTFAKETLIQGAPSADWWSRQAGDTLNRFSDEMRKGLTQNESITDLVKRVRGTKANNFNDGIMSISRNNAESLVRTSASTVASEARFESYRANDDLIKEVQWKSTLDTRTSSVCKARDGLKWDLEKKPIGHSLDLIGPPAHWRCRSVTVPLTKSWAELSGDNSLSKGPRSRGDVETIMRRKLGERGWSQDRIDKAVANTRASMDGSAPAGKNYEQWLRSRPEKVQREALGPARFKLWKKGKLPVSEMIDQRGNPLTVEQLRAKTNAE